MSSVIAQCRAIIAQGQPAKAHDGYGYGVEVSVAVATELVATYERMDTAGQLRFISLPLPQLVALAQVLGGNVYLTGRGSAA